MEAVSFLSGWISWLLLIIPVGAGATITYFAFKKSIAVDEEEIGSCNVKMRQTLKGAIVGMTISGIVTVARTWFN